MMKLKITAGVIVLLISGALYAADTVTMNITGNVIASACQISSDSVNKSVDLGQNINASALKTAGSSSDWVNFTINLDTCPEGTTKATMTLHGTADTDNPADMYTNTGTATNVAVQLQSQAGDQLGDGKTLTGDVVSAAVEYKLRARAYTQSGSVTPGTIAAVVTATFVYQ